MEDQKKDNMAQEGAGMSALSLSVSRQDFRDYFQDLEGKYGEMSCPLCKQTVWGVPPREDSNDHPAIVTLPVPNSPGRGIWAYPVICMECGYIASFGANHVSSKIKG